MASLKESKAKIFFILSYIDVLTGVIENPNGLFSQNYVWMSAWWSLTGLKTQSHIDTLSGWLSFETKLSSACAGSKMKTEACAEKTTGGALTDYAKYVNKIRADFPALSTDDWSNI